MEIGQVCKFRWDRWGRKGQRCRVVRLSGLGAVTVQFDDGQREKVRRGALEPIGLESMPPPATDDALEQAAHDNAHRLCEELVSNNGDNYSAVTAVLWPVLKQAFLSGAKAGGRGARRALLNRAHELARELVTPTMGARVRAIRITELEAAVRELGE